ncbi:MAG: glycosyltransferase family 2 protein [Candidatus Accumulibacter sp.]|uniref:Glycosyltransferase family 2 protein n=1 Tax=Candidatus Accumulibacter affinis TaxID=2954384 RepID=A0A935T6X6_9PROT|nr:glycosyltransferase family 2 protein [Candidatus Accumulibacter affinis]
MPKVSVILTSFNHAQFIGESIESVLNQSFGDFELIIWDDASADGSWEMIHTFPDRRIRSFRNSRNEGPVFGVNKAISEVATGQYIAIHHSDDVWEPDKLQQQVPVLDAHPEIGAVFTWVKIIDENGCENSDGWFNQEFRSRSKWLNSLFLSVISSLIPVF